MVSLSAIKVLQFIANCVDDGFIGRHIIYTVLTRRRVKIFSIGFQASENLFNYLAKEPKIFAYELQPLPAYEVVCTYKGLA